MIRLALPLVLLLAACTTTAAEQRSDQRAQAQIARELDGLHPGAPVQCIARDRVRETRNFRGTILYVEGRNRIYRNDVVGGCPGLAHDDLVITKSLGGSQLCQGDTVQTRARIGGVMTGSCALGQFVPYTK